MSSNKKEKAEHKRKDGEKVYSKSIVTEEGKLYQGR